MSIEILIGAVVIILVVGYIIFKDNSSDSAVDDRTVEATPAPVLEPVLEEPVEVVKKVAKPKKAATKKTAKVDLDSMKKDELLAHAKANGIKANASMSKGAILDAIKNG